MQQGRAEMLHPSQSWPRPPWTFPWAGVPQGSVATAAVRLYTMPSIAGTCLALLKAAVSAPGKTCLSDDVTFEAGSNGDGISVVKSRIYGNCALILLLQILAGEEVPMGHLRGAIERALGRGRPQAPALRGGL
jgi:hypothetical protein